MKGVLNSLSIKLEVWSNVLIRCNLLSKVFDNALSSETIIWLPIMRRYPVKVSKSLKTHNSTFHSYVVFNNSFWLGQKLNIVYYDRQPILILMHSFSPLSPLLCMLLSSVLTQNGELLLEYELKCFFNNFF